MKLELENEKNSGEAKRLRSIGGGRNESTKQFEHETKCDLRQTFGMVPQGSKMQSIISVAGHQVIRNLSEPSEFTPMNLDTYADYLR